MCKNPTKYLILQHNETLEYKAYFYGCGDRWFCPDCSERYLKEKVELYTQLLKSLFNAHGKREDIRCGCITFPREASFKLDNKAGYRRAYELFREWFHAVYGRKFGVIAALQNWGDRNPSFPRLHIHYMIMPFTEDGRPVRGFTPKIITNFGAPLIWRRILQREGLFPLYSPKKVDIFFHYANHLFKESAYWWYVRNRVLKYLFRRPISTEITDPQTGQKRRVTVEEISERSEKLKGLKRIRLFGWISPRRAKLVLSNLKVLRIERVSHYSFIGFGFVFEQCDNGIIFNCIPNAPPPGQPKFFTMAIEKKDIFDCIFIKRPYRVSEKN